MTKGTRLLRLQVGLATDHGLLEADEVDCLSTWQGHGEYLIVAAERVARLAD